MSNQLRPTEVILQKAEEQFAKRSIKSNSAITCFACIDALENIFENDLTQSQIYNIQPSLNNIIQHDEFADIVIKISKNRITPIKLNESFIIDNFSLSEIKFFKKTWEQVDCKEKGVLTTQNTRKVIETVLKRYKNSNNNDSEIKQFFIIRANRDQIYISYEEYTNFITKFIKLRKLKYQKPTTFCSFF